MAAVSLRNVSKSFVEDVNLLEDISFEIEEGERVSILGPGGCGKSTLLKMILGLLTPSSGEISLRGVDMAHASEDQKQEVLKSVGMAFQQGALFDYMTVAENLDFAMQNRTKMDPQQKSDRILTLLNGVKLGRTVAMYPFELSGGMQRRVGIARALATEPEVAIFDEPTSGLDPVTSTIILNMILAMAGSSSKNTLIVATSSVDIAMRFAKRLIMINEGRIVADGSWDDLLMNADKWVRNFLSVRLIGLDLDYVKELGLPNEFIRQHWAI